jgi:hypothetical protein
MGDQDAVLLILDDHHTVVRAQRVVAINMTLRRRGERKQVPQHRLWRGQMHANVINPAFNRRLGNGNQEQHGKEERNVPETDSAHDREVTGQPDHAVTHMLGGRDALDVQREVHPLGLGVQVRTLRNDEPILDRIMECREFMKVDVIDVLPPTDGRGRPQLPLHLALSQIELDNRRAIFNRRADKGVLVPLRDSRLKRHLHSHRPPTPFATTDVLMDT